MDILTSIEQFHFLRPLWLLLLLPASFLMWSVYQRSDSLRTWKKVIAPHLLEHLLLREGNEGGRWRPVYMLGIIWLVGIVALAGPSWRMQPSPFSEDLAAMFIVIKVTPDMLAEDIQPSRLQRSVLKIQDFLEIKHDIRTGLIAYAGSAHLAMPLTSDAGIINNFASALEPDVMPVAGDEPAEAIAMAIHRLKKAAVPGSIVLITDSIDSSQLAAFKRLREENGVDVHILAMAAGPEVIPPPGSPPAPALDITSLNTATDALGGSLTTVTPDSSDVQSLASKVETSLSHAPVGEGQQWKDSGYFLLFLIAFIALSFFRRGGSVAIE
jgi:Ca-activated chloride channel family protein